MFRLMLLYLIALITPTVIYVLWRVFAPASIGGSDNIRGGHWEHLPWIWLAPAGVAVLLVTVGSMAYFSGGSADQEYRTPRLIDGKIVPGHFLPAEGAKKDGGK